MLKRRYWTSWEIKMIADQIKKMGRRKTLSIVYWRNDPGDDWGLRVGEHGVMLRMGMSEIWEWKHRGSGQGAKRALDFPSWGERLDLRPQQTGPQAYLRRKTRPTLKREKQNAIGFWALFLEEFVKSTRLKILWTVFLFLATLGNAGRLPALCSVNKVHSWRCTVRYRTRVDCT